MTDEEITKVESPLGRLLQAARDCNEVAAEGRVLNEQLKAALNSVLSLVCRLDGLSDSIADLRKYCPACNKKHVR